MIDEVVDQQGDVLAPLAQRRQVDRHDVEPVVKVLAKAAGGGLGRQVTVGGCDQADIHSLRFAAADFIKGLVLQNVEQLGLEV